MTVQEAQSLTPGAHICCYVVDERRKGWNPSGMRWCYAKITSVKTWKTRPNQVLIGLKYGMYEFFKIDENLVHEWHSAPTHDEGDL